MASKVVPLAAPRDEAEIRAAIGATTRGTVYKALAAGQPFDAAMSNGLVQCSGAVSREVLNGGRDTITEEVQRDPRAQGWARVTGGDPCAFCAMLSGRGPVYKEDTAGFDAHDHCSCDAEPVYEGSEWPGRGREFQKRWYESDRTLNGFRQDLNKTPSMDNLGPHGMPNLIADAGDMTFKDAIKEQEFWDGPGGWGISDTPGDVKDALEKALSSDLVDNPQLPVKDLIDSWAATSGKGPVAQALQVAARREFGLDGAALDHLGVVADSAYVDSLRPFLRAMYNETQAYFDSKGITEITVYRGTKQALLDGYGTLDVALQPMSSFSTEFNAAVKFAEGHSIIAARVPVGRIISSSRTGFGCLGEREVVVLGGVDHVAALNVSKWYGGKLWATLWKAMRGMSE